MFDARTKNAETQVYALLPSRDFSRIILISPLLIIRPSSICVFAYNMVAVGLVWVNSYPAFCFNYTSAVTGNPSVEQRPAPY